MIDIHAHVVLEAALGAAGSYGPFLTDAEPAASGVGGGQLPCFRVGDYELVGVKYRHSPFMDIELRLDRMDAHGIDFQVLSPNPLTYFNHVDGDTAIAFSRRHNDALAEVLDGHRDRLGGFAQLPMQSPAEAAEELRRAVGDLGMLGAYVGTDLGRPLDDPSFDLVYATCVELDVPLFIHPAPGGIDAPRRDDRLARFDGDLWIGFAYEETLAVATLVLGGVLDRHPDLDVCVSHGGGATSWLAERMSHAAATRPWADAALRASGAVEERLGRIWWDSHVGGPRSLAALVASRGVEKLVGGTNFAGWDEGADPAFGDESLAAVLDDNARRLLRLAR